MVGLSTWFRYVVSKSEYARNLTYKAYMQGRIGSGEAYDTLMKTFFHGRLTFFHCNKREELACGSLCGTLLVRRIPIPHPTKIHVGDVVLLKDPENKTNHLVRRLAAVEGCEMVSTNEKDEPFVLENDQCWVLAENETLKPKEAYDSRTFGPVTMSSYIVGRVVYCLRTAVDHGPVQNSSISTEEDSPVLEVELDVDAMAKNHKA